MDESRLPKFSAASLKGVSVLGRAWEATIGRCNATLLRVREFSRTFRGTLALVALCLLWDKYLQNTCHLKPQWHCRSPPHLAFHPTTFPPVVCEESGTLKEKWITFCSWASIHSIWAQRQSSSCLTSQNFASVSCSVTSKMLQGRVLLQMSLSAF